MIPVSTRTSRLMKRVLPVEAQTLDQMPFQRTFQSRLLSSQQLQPLTNTQLVTPEHNDASVAQTKQSTDSLEPHKHHKIEPTDYGTIASQADPSHPAVIATRATLETGQHPERVSPFVAVPAFNQAAYDANPRAYLDPIGASGRFSIFYNHRAAHRCSSPLVQRPSGSRKKT